MIVNDVAGFIGPEVFTAPDQLERACLEDATMAKLHGITMGLDVCATFPHGHRARGAASAHRPHGRACRAGVPDGGGWQRRPDAWVSHHLVPGAPALAASGRPSHNIRHASAADNARRDW